MQRRWSTSDQIPRFHLAHSGLFFLHLIIAKQLIGKLNTNWQTTVSRVKIHQRIEITIAIVVVWCGVVWSRWRAAFFSFPLSTVVVPHFYVLQQIIPFAFAHFFSFDCKFRVYLNSDSNMQTNEMWLYVRQTNKKPTERDKSCQKLCLRAREHKN